MGFEPGTSRMRVSCVTTEPPRAVRGTGTHCFILIMLLYATKLVKEKQINILTVNRPTYATELCFFY